MDRIFAHNSGTAARKASSPTVPAVEDHQTAPMQPCSGDADPCQNRPADSVDFGFRIGGDFGIECGFLTRTEETGLRSGRLHFFKRGLRDNVLNNRRAPILIQKIKDDVQRFRLPVNKAFIGNN